MITRTEFIKTIDVIKEYYDKENKLTKYLHEFFMNGHSVVDFGSELIHRIVELLAKNMSEEHWEVIVKDIENFIYNYYFGSWEYEVSFRKGETTKTHVISNSSQLYNSIIDYLED